MWRSMTDPYDDNEDMVRSWEDFVAPGVEQEDYADEGIAIPEEGMEGIAGAPDIEQEGYKFAFETADGEVWYVSECNERCDR